MTLRNIQIGKLSISRTIIGGNPFSGFAHQTPQRSIDMKRWYTVARIKDALRQAEALGINTHISRADHHVMRYLMEYWDEGGKIQWFAQTCPELGTIDRGIENAIAGNASACYIHGGVMDNLLANNGLDQVPPAINKIHKAGIPAGIAGHNPEVFRWAERTTLPVDFYMCSYYNSAHRDKHAEHITGMAEWFDDKDRDEMVATIKGLSKPAIHYKVLAAGRNKPQEALLFVAKHLRPQDAVCVGVFTGDKADMLAENLRILEECL